MLIVTGLMLLSLPIVFLYFAFVNEKNQQSFLKKIRHSGRAIELMVETTELKSCKISSITFRKTCVFQKRCLAVSSAFCESKKQHAKNAIWTSYIKKKQGIKRSHLSPFRTMHTMKMHLPSPNFASQTTRTSHFNDGFNQLFCVRKLMLHPLVSLNFPRRHTWFGNLLGALKTAITWRFTTNL